MDADRDSNAPQPEISAQVASCMIEVGELDRSVKFYSDLFSCRVGVRETDMALLLAPNGFHTYLHAQGSSRHRAARAAGVQFLLWATDTESDLQEFAQRLRAYDPAVYSHIENGVTSSRDQTPTEGGSSSVTRAPVSMMAARLRA